MIRILNIETATKVCSVNIAANGKIIAERETNGIFNHAEKLAVFIQELLAETKMEANELDAIAVSEGPGSYTGLRIGVSTAKGICFGIQKPLIAISTLASIAHNFLEHHSVEDGHLICPMIDARRMEVYTTFYNSKLEVIKEVSPLILDENSWDNYQNFEAIYLIGDAALKCKTLWSNDNRIKVYEKFEATAKGMSTLSFEKFNQQKFESLAYFEPLYLKEFEAKISEKKMF